MNVAVVGCGLVGHKRVDTLGVCRLVACADVVLERAARLASRAAGARATTDWHSVVVADDVDLVLVSTVHRALPEIAVAAVSAGKHVLVEKPAGRRAAELQPVIDAATRAGVRVRVGFNHRYHPALIKARELVDDGVLGDLMFVRGRYGHGGRLGYEKEWRADPEQSGGGELLDQGVHLIDLARWFLGEFTEVDGFASTFFWQMPVEDNGFMMLRTARRQVAFLHASCTEWKNLFSLEIYGREGKIDINGLGGSYGTERITLYRMLPEMGPPETMAWEYPRGDQSWRAEFDEFLEDIKLGREPSAGLRDAQAALRVVESVYRRSAS
jgi:predicted dehydrogenase